MKKENKPGLVLTLVLVAGVLFVLGFSFTTLTKLRCVDGVGCGVVVNTVSSPKDFTFTSSGTFAQDDAQCQALCQERDGLESHYLPNGHYYHYRCERDLVSCTNNSCTCHTW